MFPGLVNRFGNAIDQLTTTQGYDADVGLSPDGEKMVFTSVRTGDPEIWIMDSNLTQTQVLAPILTQISLSHYII
ncbi:unnamed protein product [Anisakis simplex]|uniref:6-phosphogluconolactonase n=1 Tax=Anisakis simplex TaxID=6269 RepID=A0A0M3JDQ9_ANISI|nr:unnamed protein product [Anisakis simplex]